MFMGVYETRTLAPPPDTQEGRVEGKCSCFLENVKMWMYGTEPPGGGWYLGLFFYFFLPLASQSPYPIIVQSVANFRAHLSQFLARVIFAIST